MLLTNTKFTPCRMIAPLLLGVLFTSSALAQDMRVFTTVSMISGEKLREEPVSHSLTLFHAGKAYDYMEDVGEVVVYEPGGHRFVILGGDYLATEVPFSEVHQFLEAAQVKAREYAADVAKNPSPQNEKRAASIAFQMNPQLLATYDADQQSLGLSGDLLSYKVSTVAATSPTFHKQYLEYADWAARLNYVLHPHSVYPTSRLQLNSELRDRQLLPISVELSARLDAPVRLKARHDFREMQNIDRKLISRWEQQLKAEDTQWLTFHEYQQKLLAPKR